VIGTEWADAAFLGPLQGLTEFLPVSSSAQRLRLVGSLLPSGGDPGAAFMAITQLPALRRLPHRTRSGHAGAAALRRAESTLNDAPTDLNSSRTSWKLPYLSR
jgi:hypothetical protein